MFALRDGICGSFHNDATIQNLDEHQCTIINERKTNMLSSTDNNFMIFLFDFERFRIESRLLFLTHTV